MSKLYAIADTLRAIAGVVKNRRTAAIIVAAGSSTRMGKPKQFIPLCGVPAVVRTLKAYQASSLITSIVVVARECDIERYEKYKKAYSITKLCAIVKGGSTRQESVLLGVEAVPKKTAYVAIADGARPLTTTETIDKVCLAAYRFDAATAAFPAYDTIKTADKKGFIASTVERSTVWHAATPQVFSLALYRAAAYSAKDEGFVATDDNSLVEHIGHRIKLVDCGRENIKLTERHDVTMCEAIIKQREADK